ncbi:MAG: DNA internalization-related competence protein ComEC/Rec2 [Clostridiales bacterium]|nr:DNA internalization-related competence protein ComEC/Rec2 [Clostridiales bacterium]
MRVLATVGFSFAAGLFLTLLPWDGWQLYAAGALALASLLWALLGRGTPHLRRVLLVLLPLMVSLLYFSAYRALVRQPVQALCGGEHDFSAAVCDWPEATERGAKVTIRLHGLLGAKAVYYGDDDLLSLRPGDALSGTAWWNDVAAIGDGDLRQFSSRGVYALLYDRDTLTVQPAPDMPLGYAPQYAAKALRDKLTQLWDDPSVLGFLTAELTGDKSLLPESDYVAMQETGLAHIFAVSGLHCAFLVTLLSLLIPPTHRRTLCAVASAVLVFYMLLTGLSPSVARACVMQLFLLSAPLFRRGSDPLTSLAAALTVILLVNPYAVGSVSLQLSFAATLGMVLLSGRLYKSFTGWYRGRNRTVRAALSFLAANLAATLGALVFTAPLTAYYFNLLSLVAPLAGLLAVPAAGYAFMSAFVSALLGLVWTPLGHLAGYVPLLLVKYILWVAHLLLAVPYHAVYFTNVYLRVWLLYVYAAFLGCAVTPDGKRKYALASALTVLTLAACLWLNSRWQQYGAFRAAVLDVGQGESVALCSGSEAALVDCGSSNSYVDAGSVAADALQSAGIRRLSAMIVTHYHADHTNGLTEVLTRLPVDTLYLPDIEDEYGVRDRLVSLAAHQGADVVFVTEPTRIALGEAVLTVYPPLLTTGDLNEQGLTALATAGDFDLLITGDMAGQTEQLLAQMYPLPDVEVLVVSHHGSRYSSDESFLRAITPDNAVISVGDNRYGHPAEETLRRLQAVGATVWRTDQQGSIRIIID